MLWEAELSSHDVSIAEVDFLVQLVLSYKENEEMNPWGIWPSVTDVFQMYGEGVEDVLHQAVLVNKLTTEWSYFGVVRVKSV